MRPRTLALTLLITAILSVLPASAAADTATRRDPRGDAPAGIDIVRSHYRHAVRSVSARVYLPALSDTGSVSLAISRFDVFEAGYVAVVRRRADGTVSRRLLYFDHFDYLPRRCDVGGRWNRDTGVVTVKVPRRCLDDHRRPRLYLGARAYKRNRVDVAPPVLRLRRG